MRSPGRAESGSEPLIALPARRLMLWVAFAGLVIAGLWSGAIAIGPWDGATFISGIIGIGTTTALALCGVLVMTPWKPRPIIDWMTMWLGSTVFRLLVTPVVLFVLYSAASQALAVKPLVLSVALTYLVTLLAEAGIIASHVRRSLPSH